MKSKTQYPDKLPPQTQKRQPGKETRMDPQPVYDTRQPGLGRLKGKVAIVTGGDSGIGRAVAVSFAKEGADVVIVYLDEHEDAEQTAAVIKQYEKEALMISTDIAIEENCRQVIAQTIKKFKRLDILVNNAGFTRDKYLTKMSEEEWDSVVSTILKGSFHCTRAVLPHMMDRKWGRIVNISSRAHLGNPGQTNYSSAKAGLIGMTRSLAYELGKFNITANAVAPGLVATELVRGLETYEKLRTNALTRQPIQRMGEEDDIANAVAFLASERAGFITGETVHVTGGRYST